MKKRFLLPLSLVVCLSVGLSAQELNKRKAKGFAGISWSYTPSGGTIDSIKFKNDNKGMIGFMLAQTNLFNDNIGIYIDTKKSLSYTSSFKGQSKYLYEILNLGATFTPTDRVTFMAGVGYSKEAGYTAHQKEISVPTHELANGAYMSTTRTVTYAKEHKKHSVNFNLGASFKVSNNVGLIVGFDTAPKAVSIGFSMHTR